MNDIYCYYSIVTTATTFSSSCFYLVKQCFYLEFVSSESKKQLLLKKKVFLFFFESRLQFLGRVNTSIKSYLMDLQGHAIQMVPILHFTGEFNICRQTIKDFHCMLVTLLMGIDIVHHRVGCFAEWEGYYRRYVECCCHFFWLLFVIRYH